MFKAKPKTFLGIDIGNYSIRVIEAERNGSDFELKNYGEVINLPVESKPFGTFEQKSFSFSNEEVAKTIKEVCKKAGIQTKDVNFTIPDFYTFFISIKLPAMNKSEIIQAIGYEVRPYIPLPISEITLDWNVIEGTIGKTDLKVLVVAIPNDVVLQYKEIASLSGLDAKFLEPEVFSLARTLKKESQEKLIGLIDVGIKSTTCSIVDKGLLKTSHSFNIGGDEMTKVLARSLNVEYNKAEEIKKEKGLTGLSTKNSLIPLVDSITEEVKKVFRNYYFEKGQKIEKVVLAGGSIEMPGFKDYLGSQLKKEISIIEPFFGVSYPDILKNELKKRGPFYAIALGAALKGFE